MTKRRRTANPIYQKPLTTAEFEGKKAALKPVKAIACKMCGSTRTTLRKVKEGEYQCQDTGKCLILAQRKLLN